MKILPLILIVTSFDITFASADFPENIKGQVFVDATMAVSPEGKIQVDADRRVIIGAAEQKIREDIIREASDLICLNPGVLAEFNLLTEHETGGSPISAVILQEIITDYESAAKGKPIPALVSFYISKSKVEVLSSRKRVLCYLMIKSAMRPIKSTK